MTDEIVRLKKEDYREAIDFLNFVYEFNDLPDTLKKIYEPDDEKMRCILAIKKNGNIRAIVGVFPVSVSIMGTGLNAAIIGGVSVHPDDRGKGYMKQLMEKSQKMIIEAGYHFSCLGGSRQRYRFFNYEKAGTTLQYAFNKSDIKHCKDMWQGFEDIRFEKICEDDKDKLNFAETLNESQPFYVKRDKGHLYWHLTTWNCEPWAAYNEKGDMIGYLVRIAKESGICEISAVSEQYLGKMIIKWVMDHDKNDVILSLPPWAYEQARTIGNISESFSIKTAYMFQIIDWVTVIRVLAVLKSKHSPFPDGKIIIDIEGYGKVMLAINKGIVSCMLTGDEADIKLDKSTATRLIFGPLSQTYVCDLNEKSALLLTSWFPLPLSWLMLDGA
jgi:predicted acetyltransferase